LAESGIPDQDDIRVKPLFVSGASLRWAGLD